MPEYANFHIRFANSWGRPGSCCTRLKTLLPIRHCRAGTSNPVPYPSFTMSQSTAVSHLMSLDLTELHPSVVPAFWFCSVCF